MLIVEGIDLTFGIKGHPELVCVAIVVDGTVVVLENEQDETPAKREEGTKPCSTTRTQED